MPRAIDLFCGCGGLSLGFQNAGFQIVHAFDNWDKAVNIYNTNFDDHEAEILDVYNLTTEYLNTFRPDVIIGGPPCQDYSSAGHQDETRGRANLTIRFAELVCESGVQWFVMENVDRIEKSQTLPKAIAMFRDAGYGLTRVVLDASRCGVPQKRKRFFMIGRLGSEDDFLEHSLLSDQDDHNMTIREYLGDEFDTEFYYRHPRSYARRGIFSIDEPSPTVRGVNRPIPATYQIHPGDATDDLSRVRPLTTLERARIQTFPKKFTFEGSKTDLEQIIGNAVPVELAAYVGRHLLDYMNDCLGKDL
ncbi:DNA cytosine methyltransferase [Ruminococcus sp.]|uniref:DNA cytosine methyltransferase n=1 Tax=Ruminococcus sp. TaxID=41978 RepID=UPI00352730EF